MNEKNKNKNVRLLVDLEVLSKSMLQTCVVLGRAPELKPYNSAIKIKISTLNCTKSYDFFVKKYIELYQCVQKLDFLFFTNTKA